MNVLVTGAGGQLGTDVVTELTNRNVEHTGIDIDDLDITDTAATRSYLTQHRPKSVIHCAAYTAVDQAEDEPELCDKVNINGTANIAKACRDIDAEMIYISTDYVFDGSGSAPYETGSPTGPISAYGKSKLAGEEAVLSFLEKNYIVRTSWVYGINGNNFVKAIISKAITELELRVVNDQFGSPTYTPDLAVLLCDMALSGRYGIYHATNEGFCTWYDFAEEILRQCGSTIRINPVPSTAYPVKAKRPMYSALSKKSLDLAGFNRLPQWQDALARFITAGGFTAFFEL